jgi:quercetin dioxygenase-like cupin family protein
MRSGGETKQFIIQKKIRFSMEDIRKFIVRTSEKEWLPLTENGIHYKGVFVMSLRYNEEQKRSNTILLKFEPGASYPYHNHPAGEELFVLTGSCEIVNTILVAGDYLHTPPNYKHSVKSENGCTMLLSIPEEVELIK